jgi:hypothetical protein
VIAKSPFCHLPYPSPNSFGRVPLSFGTDFTANLVNRNTQINGQFAYALVTFGAFEVKEQTETLFHNDAAFNGLKLPQRGG